MSVNTTSIIPEIQLKIINVGSLFPSFLFPCYLLQAWPNLSLLVLINLKQAQWYLQHTVTFNFLNTICYFYYKILQMRNSVCTKELEQHLKLRYLRFLNSAHNKGDHERQKIFIFTSKATYFTSLNLVPHLPKRERERDVMYASTWNRAPKTQAVTLIIQFDGQELATLKSNQMSSAEYSTGSHEHTAIVLSSPEIMCSCVCKGNYINLGITETSG